MPTAGRAAMLRLAARAIAIVAACGAAGLVAGCGSIAGSTTVVRVGNDAISKTTVEHWIGVIERKGTFVGRRGEPRGTPEQRALALLISSNWLIGEAALQGVPISAAAVDEALAADEHVYSEFRARSRRAGQTIADVKLEVKSELAAEALREKLARRIDQVQPEHSTSREVVEFYRRHLSLFGTGTRVTDLIERQSSPAAARAAARGLGKSQSSGGEAFHERVTRDFSSTPDAEKAAVIDAIFAARPGVVSSPVLLLGSWTVFVVRKVILGKPMPFAQARPEALRRLSEYRQQAIVSSFGDRFSSRWKARTRCLHGYSGPGCPQSSRPLEAYEDPFSFTPVWLLPKALAQG
jgi:PPIC-type PPIASE domain